MGNRAIITGKESHIGVYVHWNGGRDSVEAMLETAYYRSRTGLGADAYDQGLTTLINIASNFLGDSVTIVTIDPENLFKTDPGDNGVYVVDENWEIIDRVNAPDEEQYSHDHLELMITIDEHQPAHLQLGEEFLRAEKVDPHGLKVNDEVFIRDKYGDTLYKKVRVVHIGNPTGEKVPGGIGDNAPYLGTYAPSNPNGYLTEDDCHKGKARLAVPKLC